MKTFKHKVLAASLFMLPLSVSVQVLAAPVQPNGIVGEPDRRESDFSQGTQPVVGPKAPPAPAPVPVPMPDPQQRSPSDSLSAFSQGLVHHTMTEAEISNLREYLNNSREKLQKALNQAKGKTSLEAITVYERAILEIVPTSNKSAGALELLMRMSLNQGLDLVMGVPGSSRGGALQYSQNTGLKAQILEGSILLAMKYFMDPKGLNSDALSRLPFRELGWNRLHQTLRWWGGIEDSAVALEFVERSLGHWLAIAQMAKNDVPLMAQEMVDVNNILVSLSQTRKDMPTMSTEKLDEELRELRGQFENLLDTLQRKAQAR